MKTMSEVISFCWKMHHAAGQNGIRLESLRVVLPLADAEAVHAALVSVAPGSDRVRVAWTRESRNAALPFVVETVEVEKPSVPEANTEWLSVFGVKVFVINC